jgi:hypothetical protein
MRGRRPRSILIADGLLHTFTLYTSSFMLLLWLWPLLLVFTAATAVLLHK